MKKAAEKQIIQSMFLCDSPACFSSRVSVNFTWYCPNKKRDHDNICFAKKFILDALVSGGILKNDSWECVNAFSDRFEIDKFFPRVEVEITED